MAIHVLLVDDQILTRIGLRAVLEEAHDITIVGEAEDGPGALARALETRPNIVLMDLKMAGGDGIEATRAIRQHCPDTQVLVLSVYADAGLFRKAVAAGAAGYVLKDISPGDLAAAIRSVYHGKTMINPGIARQLLEDIAGNGLSGERAQRGHHGLTEREIEVLAEVAQGLGDKEIAAKLFLSESTVKSHLRAIYRRLRLRNRAQAAAFAIETNLLAARSALTPRETAGAFETASPRPSGRSANGHAPSARLNGADHEHVVAASAGRPIPGGPRI